jgi:hypothetical protein
MLRIGRALNPALLGPDALCRAVSAFEGVRRFAVNFDQLRIVYVASDGPAVLSWPIVLFERQQPFWRLSTRQSPLQSQADLWSRPVLRRSVPIRLKKRKGRPKPPCRGLSKARDELSAVSLRLLRIRDLRPVLHKSSGVRFAPE